MPKFKVTFHQLIQDSQDYGSDDDQMVSRVFFSLNVDGRPIGNFTADLKQVVGSDFETGDIEVGPPTNYDGPFDHQGFGDAARRYFRSLIGQGSAIHFVGVRNLRMRNNRINREAEFTF